MRHHRHSHFPTGYILVIFLFTPLVLFALSWNALPDTTLFSTKRTFEAVAQIPLSPSREYSVRYHIFLLNRRVVEAKSSIPQGSVTPLAEITNQADHVHQLITTDATIPRKTLSDLFSTALSNSISKLDDIAAIIKYETSKTTNDLTRSNRPPQTNSDSPFSLPEATKSKTNDLDLNNSRFLITEITKTQHHLNYILSKYSDSQ